MLQNLLSAAVVIGALRVKPFVLMDSLIHVEVIMSYKIYSMSIWQV